MATTTGTTGAHAGGAGTTHSYEDALKKLEDRGYTLVGPKTTAILTVATSLILVVFLAVIYYFKFIQLNHWTNLTAVIVIIVIGILHFAWSAIPRPGEQGGLLNDEHGHGGSHGHGGHATQHPIKTKDDGATVRGGHIVLLTFLGSELTKYALTQGTHYNPLSIWNSFYSFVGIGRQEHYLRKQLSQQEVIGECKIGDLFTGLNVDEKIKKLIQNYPLVKVSATMEVSYQKVDPYDIEMHEHDEFSEFMQMLIRETSEQMFKNKTPDKLMKLNAVKASSELEKIYTQILTKEFHYTAGGEKNVGGYLIHTISMTTPEVDLGEFVAQIMEMLKASTKAENIKMIAGGFLDALNEKLGDDVMKKMRPDVAARVTAILSGASGQIFEGFGGGKGAFPIVKT